MAARLWSGLNLLLNIAAAGLAAWGIAATLIEHGEPGAIAIDRAGTSLGVALAAGIHLRLWYRCQDPARLLALYALAYPLTAASCTFWLRSMAKGFAPNEPATAALLYALGGLWLASVLFMPVLISRKIGAASDA